jgi:hypothetical protein
MARSATIAELNLDTAPISEALSVTMPRTVDSIIPSPRPSQPKKMQFAVDGPITGIEISVLKIR